MSYDSEQCKHCYKNITLALQSNIQKFVTLVLMKINNHFVQYIQVQDSIVEYHKACIQIYNSTFTKHVLHVIPKTQGLVFTSFKEAMAHIIKYIRISYMFKPSMYVSEAATYHVLLECILSLVGNEGELWKGRGKRRRKALWRGEERSRYVGS